MGGMPRFLIVEDQAVMARALDRFFQLYGETRVVSSGHAAVDALREPQTAWSGAVIDWKLDSDDGLEVVREARRLHPTVPILVLTAFVEPECINEVHALGAQYACKPVPRENLRAFVERSVAHSGGDPLERCVAELAREHGLSPREAEILAAAVQGMSRSEVATQLGVRESTVKTLVRRLLAKTGYPNMRVLVGDVMASALARARG